MSPTINCFLTLINNRRLIRKDDSDKIAKQEKKIKGIYGNRKENKNREKLETSSKSNAAQWYEKGHPPHTQSEREISRGRVIYYDR